MWGRACFDPDDEVAVTREGRSWCETFVGGLTRAYLYIQPCVFSLRHFKVSFSVCFHKFGEFLSTTAFLFSPFCGTYCLAGRTRGCTFWYDFNSTSTKLFGNIRNFYTLILIPSGPYIHAQSGSYDIHRMIVPRFQGTQRRGVLPYVSNLYYASRVTTCIF